MALHPAVVGLKDAVDQLDEVAVDLTMTDAAALTDQEVRIAEMVLEIVQILLLRKESDR